MKTEVTKKVVVRANRCLVIYSKLVLALRLLLAGGGVFASPGSALVGNNVNVNGNYGNVEFTNLSVVNLIAVEFVQIESGFTADPIGGIFQWTSGQFNVSIDPLYCNTTNTTINNFRHSGIQTNYFPMLKNTTWLSTLWGSHGYINSYYQFINDTIINNIVYKRIDLNYINLPGITNDPFMSGQSAFYIREDTITKKIYLYNSFLGDLLQYNFALQVGDTFPNNNVNDYILTSIDTVPIASGSRRRFIFNNSSTIPIIWIEGIGNMADPFNPPRRYDSTFANILCVHENLNLVYEYPFMFPVTCGLYNSDSAITNSKSIADIFPNPVHDLLNVVFYSNSIFQNKILVFDVTGRELVNFNCKDRFIKLNFENQPNGIYLIKIIESDHVFSILIIKN